MGMDLWFREDVVRILACAHETMRSTSGAVRPDCREEVATYHQGFVDALRVVAIAFGVVTPGLGARDANPDLADHSAWLLGGTE
jgi:hypothetical protein